jgi:hypothetical protein
MAWNSLLAPIISTWRNPMTKTYQNFRVHGAVFQLVLISTSFASPILGQDRVTEVSPIALCRALVAKGAQGVVDLIGSDCEVSFEQKNRTVTFATDGKQSTNGEVIRYQVPLPFKAMQVRDGRVRFVRDRGPETKWNFYFPFLEQQAAPDLGKLREAKTLRELIDLFVPAQVAPDAVKNWFINGNGYLPGLVKFGESVEMVDELGFSASYEQEGRLVFVALVLEYPMPKAGERAGKLLDTQIEDRLIWLWETTKFTK